MSNLYHRGENIFLYVQFKSEDGTPLSVDNPMVRIFHEKNGTIFIDLDWFSLEPISTSEYYANYAIEHIADYGTYEVVYVGEYDSKVARVVESFRVIPSSTVFENVVKVYGYVNQSQLGTVIPSVFVKVFNETQEEIIFEATTKENGYWEVYVYPGEYQFVFEKVGFLKFEQRVQIGLEHNEVQFNNITLELKNSINSGTGMYKVHDRYITREGLELSGLDIRASSCLSPNLVLAENKTDKDGNWELFLDPGNYFVKISGYFYDSLFEQKFRLKVEDDGSFFFQNLSSNVAVPAVEEEYISQGDGSVSISDVVIDKNGHPIVDVQVSVFIKGDLNNIVAQDYTTPSGKWQVYLNPGNYVFEYYHPQYDVITEEKVVR